jgi:hypothetical protein
MQKEPLPCCRKRHHLPGRVRHVLGRSDQGRSEGHRHGTKIRYKLGQGDAIAFVRTSIPNRIISLRGLRERMDFTSGTAIEKRVFGKVPRWRGPRDARSISGTVLPRAANMGQIGSVRRGGRDRLRHLEDFVQSRLLHILGSVEMEGVVNVQYKRELELEYLCNF